MFLRYQEFEKAVGEGMFSLKIKEFMFRCFYVSYKGIYFEISKMRGKNRTLD